MSTPNQAFHATPWPRVARPGFPPSLPRSARVNAGVRRHNYGSSDIDKGDWPMRLLVAAVLALALTSIVMAQEQSATGNQRSSIEQTIRQLDGERIQAQIGADAAALDRIYADDFIGVGPSGTVRTKKQVISDFTSGTLKFQSITTDEVQVRVYENTAVETGLSTMNGQDKGKAVPRNTRFTRVWVKQQGNWRLVANHYSLQSAPN